MNRWRCSFNKNRSIGKGILTTSISGFIMDWISREGWNIEVGKDGKQTHNSLPKKNEDTNINVLGF